MPELLIRARLLARPMTLALAVTLASAFSAGMALALEPVSTTNGGPAAIGGKDTVAYHDVSVRAVHQARTGTAMFVVEYLGATWRFTSQASADRFAADPTAYAPQYNGHCSNALALGEGLIPTDGSVWEFFGGRLHLFYAERGRQRWLAGDWQTYKAQADAAWLGISAGGDR